MPRLETAGGGWLHLRPLAYKWPDSADYWDGNWLVSEFGIMADGLEVSLRRTSSLRTLELKAFVMESHLALAGRWPAVTFEGARAGAQGQHHAPRLRSRAIAGERRAGPRAAVARAVRRPVSALLEVDRQRFERFLAELEQELQPFPVRGLA
jgi:hypothetical protein